MATLESRDPDKPKSTTTDEHFPDSDVMSRRRELARLIGRLLAKHWLRQQQREGRRSPIDARRDGVSHST